MIDWFYDYMLIPTINIALNKKIKINEIERWTERTSNPRPRAYCALALITELSGRMMKRA